MIYERDCKSRFMLLCDLCGPSLTIKEGSNAESLTGMSPNALSFFFFSVAKLYFFKTWNQCLQFCDFMSDKYHIHYHHTACIEISQITTGKLELWHERDQRSANEVQSAIFEEKRHFSNNPDNGKYFKNSRRRTFLCGWLISEETLLSHPSTLPLNWVDTLKVTIICLSRAKASQNNNLALKPLGYTPCCCRQNLWRF